MTEAELQQRVLEMCETLELTAFHGWARNLPGWPDLVIIGESVLFAELKSQYGVLSRDQVRIREILGGAGQEYKLWKPQNLLSGEILADLVHIRRPSESL